MTTCCDSVTASAVGAPDSKKILIAPHDLGQLILEQLLAFFSEQASSGAALLEHEALHIAGGIVLLAMQKGHALDTRQTI